MRRKAWHVIALSVLLVLGGVSGTHLWLIHTTSSAMEYQAAAGRLLGLGAGVRTWFLSPLLVGTALCIWLLRGQRVFVCVTGAFGILWLHAVSFELYLVLVRTGVFRFSRQTRVGWILAWIASLLLAYSLLAFGVAWAVRELSARAPMQTEKQSQARAWQFSVWHLVLLILAVSPFLAIARLVIPALQMSLQEFLHYNLVYLVIAPIYFVFTLLLLRWWPSTKSLAVVAFSVGLGLQCAWYLLELSVGGDKIANVPPESAFYAFLLVRGPAQFWVPLVSDVLLLLGTCLLSRDLRMVESRLERKEKPS